MVRRNSIKRFLRVRHISIERLSLLLAFFFCSTWILRFPTAKSPTIEFVSNFPHRSKSYDISNRYITMNLIDQFLDTFDSHDRDLLWPILIQSWSNSFQSFVKRSEVLCSTKSVSSFDFIHQYFDDYTKHVLADNLFIERHLTGFGLFFDYDPRQMRMKTNHKAYELQLSECPYFDLIILLMKIQFVLHRLQIPYFLSRNSLIGAVRHHDIIPWASIVALNLPETRRDSIIEQLPSEYDLVIERVNDSSIDQNEIGFIYRVMTKEKSWPYVELFFYKENQTDIFCPILNDDTLNYLVHVKKSDVYPVHLRPFGPLLVHSMNNPTAMFPKENLNVCEIHSWNHQSARAIERNRQWRIPCEQLSGTFEFVRSRQSWRRGFAEETLKTQQRPYRTFSYFRYVDHENRTSLFR